MYVCMYVHVYVCKYNMCIIIMYVCMYVCMTLYVCMYSLSQVAAIEMWTIVPCTVQWGGDCSQISLNINLRYKLYDRKVRSNCRPFTKIYPAIKIFRLIHL